MSPQTAPQPPEIESPAPAERFRLLDLVAITVGYGLAALLVRAYAPAIDGSIGSGVVAALSVVYAWLGLAMSGPVVLLLDRRSPPDPGPISRHSRGELAWLMIGAYWIILAVLVVPTRLAIDPSFGLLPVLAALVLWTFAPKRPGSGPGRSWTRIAAIVLLATWPIAWGALILLGQTLG